MKGHRYTYKPHRNSWAVYEWKYTKRGASGIKVAEFHTREEARAEVYRLNGWRTADHAPLH